jgi:hypothetical protein
VHTVLVEELMIMQLMQCTTGLLSGPLFVIFLYLTASYLKEAFIFAMFSYILINTILSPMMFISKNKVSA